MEHLPFDTLKTSYDILFGKPHIFIFWIWNNLKLHKLISLHAYMYIFLYENRMQFADPVIMTKWC